MKQRKLLLYFFCLLLGLFPIFTLSDFFSFNNNKSSIEKLPFTNVQNILVWNKTWGGQGQERGKAIAKDSSGNVFITGLTDSNESENYDVFIVKYDSNGNIVWETTWGRSKYDYGYGIAIDHQGNAFITGSSYSKGTRSNDVFLLKLDSVGNLLWVELWGGSGYEKGWGVAIDHQGNAFISGYTYSFSEGNNYLDVFLLKYDTSGNQQWVKIWGGPDNDYGQRITIDYIGNIYITGYTKSYGGNNKNVFLLKYNSFGIEQWYRIWVGANEDYGWEVATDRSGNVFITGSTKKEGATSFDMLLLKYDSSGILLWNKTWGGSYDDRGRGIVVDSLGSIAITGYTESYGAGRADVFLLMYNSSGNLISSTFWGTSYWEMGYGIVGNSTRTLFITGEGFVSDNLKYQAFLLKYEVDWDEDGLSDNDELNIYYTDPDDPDSDSDGLRDDYEINEYNTDPNNIDSDGDRLSDYDEIHIHKTNPNAQDSDGDRLSDYDEIHIHKTNPNAQDSDNDGFNDKEEIGIGTDPNNKLSNLLMIIVLIVISVILVLSSIAMYLLLAKKKAGKE